jgi:uncharacterized protein YdiU (UPF0061 family)
VLLNISGTFNKELPSDSNIENTRRQIFEATHSYVSSRLPSNPKLIHASAKMTEAVAYASHQFGSWAGQLPDGRAVLRLSIREYLCSEAMFHLGVSTTRAFLMLSGDDVLRDILYDRYADSEKGAIVSRLAPAFIRFGDFELLDRRKDSDNLKN